MKTFSSRRRAIKRQKANLALVVAGCLIMLLAVAWRLAIAPALKVEPTDIDQVLYYSGAVTYYVNPPGQPAVGAQPVRVPVRIETFFSSRPTDSTPSTAILTTETNIFSADTGQVLSTIKHTYAIDRKTGKMVGNNKADRDRSGYYLVFPFDTPRWTAPLWSELTGKTCPAKYQKSETVDRVSVYDFAMSYGNQPVAVPPNGFPAELTGAQLKEILSMPDLTIGDSQVMAPLYTGSSAVNLKVEPRMGTIVETSRFQESVSMTVNAPSGDLLVTRALYSLDYSQVQQSVAQSAEFARDEVAKLKLQFVYIPLGLLVLGLAILAIGLFAGVKAQPEKAG